MRKPIAVLRYLLSVHILALTILLVLRCILYITNKQQVIDIENRTELLLKALLKGIQFDNVIACGILALPLLVLTILSLFDRLPKIAIKCCNVYFIVLYSIVFAVSVADIPYFAYYYTHMGGSIFNWLAFGTDTGGMILQESSYYLYFGLYFMCLIIFSMTVTFFGKILLKNPMPNGNKTYYYLPLMLVIYGLCFIGIRGGLERYPIRIGVAYFCDNSFFNQLGINPTFFLVKSTSKSMKEHNNLKGTLNEDDAIEFVQKELGIDKISGKSFIDRQITPECEALNANVVVVLMESMSSEFLEYKSKGKSLTPFLNDLISRSYYFENFYSAGIHTNNGIASTLYGFPPQFDKTMMDANTDHYTGLPFNLGQKGYQTLFFITGNPQYDNMNSFLIENGFDRIYSQYDYPNDKIVNNFGVQDNYLFEYGIGKLNEAAQKGKPFFSTFLTVSNHPPFVIPKEFENIAEKEEECIVAFADNSIKEFMEEAEKQEWYKNTIFVFLGDHGKVIGQQPYDMSISYNHVPLIIYSPLFDDTPMRLAQFGGQIDVFPTVMGLLNHSYSNNTLGVDLFKTERPYMFFVSDNHLGCIDDQYFYMYEPTSKKDGLYKYRTKDRQNLISKHPAIADSMKNYAISMMVTSNYIVSNKLSVPKLASNKSKD